MAAGLLLGAIVRRDRGPLLVTLSGCAIAALIAVYQFTVLASFLGAANAAPRYVGADVWVMAKGVPAFDFAYPIDEDYRAGVLRHFPGATVRAVVSGFGLWNAPSGDKGTLAVVGVEGFPYGRRAFVFDRSDTDFLQSPHHGGSQLDDSRLLREIGQLRFDRAVVTDSLATFLGSPYVFVHLQDARAALRMPNDQVTFLAIDLPPDDIDLDAALAAAAQDYPELSILANADFQRVSAIYWLLKTGAGAAIALSGDTRRRDHAALAHQRYRPICRALSPLIFMTLVGLGYDRVFITRLISRVALGLAISATLIAGVLLPLAVALTEPLVPWVEPRLAGFAFALGLTLIAALLARRGALTQVNRLNMVDVFRT